MNKITAKISLLIFGYVVIYCIFIGLSSTPQEVDSLSYHLPLANQLLKLQIFQIDYNKNPLFLYPAAGEIILALFQFFSLPLNLFNVLALVCLFGINYQLAKTIKLTRSSSLIFAVSSCLLPVVLRITPTQKIDLWLSIFFLASLFLLLKKPATKKHYFQLGLTLGLLSGSKYSGLALAILLIIFYYRNWKQDLRLDKLIIFLIPFILLGGFWYIRNYCLTGQAFFIPAYLFTAQFYKLIINQNQFWMNLLAAAFSQLLLWSLSLLVIISLLIGNVLNPITKKISGLALLALSINFLLPINPQETIHWFRFCILSFILFMLVIFKEGERWRQINIVTILALVNQITVLTLLEYRPKIIIGYSLAILSAFFIHLTAIKIPKAKPIKQK
jgi:hypothetical protein